MRFWRGFPKNDTLKSYTKFHKEKLIKCKVQGEELTMALQNDWNEGVPASFMSPLGWWCYVCVSFMSKLRLRLTTLTILECSRVLQMYFRLIPRWTYRDPDSRHEACTSSNQTEPSAKSKWTQSVTPNQEMLSDWFLLGEGQWVFSNGVSLDTSSTLPGRPHAQEHWANRKQTPWFLSVIFLFVLFILFWS